MEEAHAKEAAALRVGLLSEQLHAERLANDNERERTMKSQRVYHGRRLDGRARVTVNGVALRVRLDLRNHSPDGFEWGYGGSGPAQLALALLADALGEDDRAQVWYQTFKWRVVSGLPDEWTLTADEIRLAVQTYELEERPGVPA